MSLVAADSRANHEGRQRAGGEDLIGSGQSCHAGDDLHSCRARSHSASPFPGRGSRRARRERAQETPPAAVGEQSAAHRPTVAAGSGRPTDLAVSPGEPTEGLRADPRRAAQARHPCRRDQHPAVAPSPSAGPGSGAGRAGLGGLLPCPRCRNPRCRPTPATAPRYRLLGRTRRPQSHA